MLYFDSENAARQYGWTIVSRSNETPVLYRGNEYQIAKATRKLSPIRIFFQSLLLGIICLVSLGIALASRRICQMKREVTYGKVVSKIFCKTFNQFTIAHPDGFNYEGETVDGKPHGKGVCTYPEGSEFASYKGDWENGQPHGKGELITPEGDRIEATFNNGEPEGEMICKNTDGTKIKWTIRGERKYSGRYIQHLTNNERPRPSIPPEWI